MRVPPPPPSDSIGFAVLAVSGALWLTQTPPGPTSTSLVAMAALLSAAIAAEWWPVTLWIRGNALHSTLSGLVVVIGVVLVGPVPTLLARVVAGVLGLHFRWRNPPAKLRYNAVVHITEVWVVATIFWGIVEASPSGPLEVAMAVTAALFAADLIGFGLVALVLRVTVGPLRMEAVRPMLLAVAATAGIAATAGTVAIHLLQTDAAAAAAFGVVLGLLVISNRSRHELVERHRATTSLYTFMEQVEGRHSVQEVLHGILTTAEETMGAEDAALLLSTDRGASRVRRSGAGELQVEEVDPQDLRALMAAVGTGLLVPEGGARPCPVLLGQPGSTMLAVGLRHDSVEGALLLDGRLGAMPAYDRDDLALAAAMARHAAISLGTVRVLEALGERTAQLERSALHDHATGLPNADGLVARLRSLDAGTVLIVDLPDVEEVSAAFGHSVVADLATAIADRLVHFAEPAGHLVARVGEGRFAVVMRAPRQGDERHAVRFPTSPAGLRQVVASLRQSLAGPIAGSHLHLAGRVRVAAAAAPDHGTDTAELLRRATSALLEADAGGPLDIRWFTEAQDRAASGRLELAGDLREAIDAGALTLAYQPQVELATGRIVGVEALARWEHPVRGPISPVEFIDVAEQTGLVRPLTMWVVDAAVAQAAAWRAQGHDLQVAVNLSATTMQDEALACHIISACAVHRVPPSQITVEVTESQMMGDLERSSGILSMLNAAGVALAIDDFGTGYSSLAQLRTLPVDELKIDRAFITSLATSEEDRAITEAVVRMARTLQLRVVAEGIEDALSLHHLRALGCDLGQGFHLHRPMTAEDITEVLAGDAAPRPGVRVVDFRSA